MQRIDVQLSTPRQKVSTLIATRDFLWRLTNPRLITRASRPVRAEARALLRHYPPSEELRPLLMEAYGADFDELTPPRLLEGKREPNGNRWVM